MNLVRKRFLESQGWYFACLESLDTIIPVLCYEGRNTQALCTTNSCNSSAMPPSRKMPILVWFWENLEEFKKMSKQQTVHESKSNLSPKILNHASSVHHQFSCNSSAMPRFRKLPILVWFCENLEESIKWFLKVNLT